ncbi:MAG: MBL fold metallo-hydrolase [Candidatus Micrarchaeota archaeon]|nr:MBL fold metallo-hydrolase [Candidatus Micrarchaeota archaeon]
MDERSINWIDHAGFLLRQKSQVLYIDPFKLNKTKVHADTILITHPHSDHLSPDDIRKIADSGTNIYVPKDSVDKIPVGNVIGVEPDRKYTDRGFEFRTVPAYNKAQNRIHFHPRESKWVGYIVTFGEKKVYHAGDTDFIDEMKTLSTNIALLPIGGTYVMEVDEAIDAAHAIDSESYSPIHYRRLLGREGSKLAEQKFLANVKGARILEQLEDPSYSF